jgi:hypothetical protein
VVIQCIMVACVILFPQMVMHYKKSGVQLDPAAIQKQLEGLTPGGAGGGFGAPGGLPPLDLNAPPKL